MRHSTEFSDTSPLISEAFKSLAPHLLDLVAHSPDPDAALAGIEALAVPYRDQLYELFQGRPDFMWRLVRLASGAAPDPATGAASGVALPPAARQRSRS